MTNMKGCKGEFEESEYVIICTCRYMHYKNVRILVNSLKYYKVHNKDSFFV